jgi:hypothetical protein
MRSKSASRNFGLSDGIGLRHAFFERWSAERAAPHVDDVARFQAGTCMVFEEHDFVPAGPQGNAVFLNSFDEGQFVREFGASKRAKDPAGRDGFP